MANNTFTPPSMPRKSQKVKRPLVIIAVVALAIIGWFVAAHFFGPDSESAVASQVERLQKDSIALQGDFSPKGKYTNLRDIRSEVEKLRDLGNPLRFGSTEIDSARLFGNPKTASIAIYNIHKCDSVLEAVLPKWRAATALALADELKDKNENTIVKIDNGSSVNTKLEIYSARYISKEEMDKDAKEFNRILASLGFTKVLYSNSPQSGGVEFTLK